MKCKQSVYNATKTACRENIKIDFNLNEGR